MSTSSLGHICYFQKNYPKTSQYIHRRKSPNLVTLAGAEVKMVNDELPNLPNLVAMTLTFPSKTHGTS
jgi:hypothetical protein